jgi:hypothetical protein
MPILNWKTTEEDSALISAIADRAVALAAKFGVDYRKDMALMDLTAVHLNACKLDLRELLTAGDGDFGHDVFGIRRHFNRRTGKLEDCFVPRFVVREGR